MMEMSTKKALIAIDGSEQAAQAFEYLFTMMTRKDDINTSSDVKCEKKKVSTSQCQPSPFLTAGLFSKLTFWWMKSLVLASRRRPLNDEDVYAVPSWAAAKRNQSEFESSWTALSGDKQKKKGQLLIQLMLHFKWKISCVLLAFTVLEVIRFIQPILVAALVVRLNEENLDPITYVYWSAIVVSFIVVCFMTHHMYFQTDIIGMAIRTTCSAMIYKKALTMSNGAYRLHKSGHIVSLMSTDVESYVNLIKGLPALFFGPFWIIAFFASQVDKHWISAFVFLVAISIVVIALCLNAKTMGKLRLEKEAFTSKRVHFMSEVISSMRVVKMYCWERPFAALAKERRKSEMMTNMKRLIRAGISIAVSFSLPNTITYLILMVQSYTGYPITPGNTIFIVGAIKAMQYVICHLLPWALISTCDVIASSERIQEFLLAEDQVRETSPEVETPFTAEVTLQNASAVWDQEAKDIGQEVPAAIRNINLTASSGLLIGITGRIGSGKSSLLMALIGELPLTEGLKTLRGSVAYVPQESWMLSETVRKNIILDNEFQEAKYKAIITACSLDLDLQHLPQGDMTLVGERGLSLSGGQKSRINLARAVYQDADIYLLDDPFAAIDNKVGKHIFNECITTMLRSKLRILVTHHLQYLKKVDNLLILEKGEISVSCSGHEITHALENYIHYAHEKDNSSNVESKMYKEDSEDNRSEKAVSYKSPSLETETEMRFEGETEVASLETEEEGETYSEVYLKYLKAGHPYILLAACLSSLATSVVMDVLSAWLLSSWDTSAAKMFGNDTEMSQRSSANGGASYALTVGGIVLVLIFSSLMFGVLLAVITIKCSRTVYNNMFSVVLHAPIDFFDRNPVGQILNRFSRDTGFMDYTIFLPLAYALMYCGIVTAYVVFICITSPWMLIIAGVFTVAIVSFFRYTMSCVRSLRRLEGRSRSPTYSHLSATLQGLTVIRAFGKQPQFLSDALSHMDTHTATWYLFLSAQRFLALGVSLLALVFVLAHLTITLLSKELAVGESGLSINSLQYLLSILYLALMMLAEIEIVMTSVGRILQFSTLEQEAPEHTTLIPPERWPSHGHIHITNMCVTYRGQQKPALGPISVDIQAKEKVGVVGRTGAGKSSLFGGLLRMVEPTGSIEIDGLDVTKMGLTDLRSGISVIPQDPVLFSGSLRFNLDPFTDFSDDQLWHALNQVQLAPKAEGLTGGLSGEMGEAGRNFSVGERQLLCLARALLRHNRIIIVDEATANVDNRSDAIIQATLLKEFKDATVVTIAHRLHTIITYDKILVLDQGKCVEFGHPHDLLCDESGMFHQMVKRLGPKLYANLEKLARTSSDCAKDSCFNYPKHKLSILPDEVGCYDNFTDL